MNASLAALTGALLIASCPWAQAASSADLTVKGSITPSACTPSLSHNGQVDYGKISAQDLNPADITELPRTLLRMAVNCEGKSLFALAPRDNRLSTPLVHASFVLGHIAPDQWVGTYFLNAENVMADDPSAYPIHSLDNGSTWLFNPNRIVSANSLFAFGKLSGETRAPVPIQDVSLDLVVAPFIFPKNQLPVDDTIPLDGSATFELRYL